MTPDTYHTADPPGQSRFVWTAVLAGIVLAGLCFGVRMYVDYSRVIRRAEERLLTQTRVVDENITTNLTVINLILDNIIKRLEETSDPVLLNSYLKHELVMSPLVRTLNIIDRQGRCVYSNREELLGKDLGHRDYFKIPRDAADKSMLFVSSPYTTISGTYAINITKPLTGKQGEFNGIITITLDSKYFLSLLKSTLYAPDNRVSLVHSDGTVFIAVPEPKIAVTGQKVSEPGSAFFQHNHDGTLTSVRRGVGKTIGDKRIYAHHTNSPKDLRMDRQIVVAASRNLNAVLSEWWVDSGIDMAIYLLFAYGTIIFTRVILLRRIELKRLTETQVRLASIVESSDDAIISENLDGVVLSWNAGAERLFMYSQEESLGRSVTMLIPSELLCEEEQTRQRLQTGERVERCETVRVARDGRRIDVSITSSPIRNSSGLLVGASKIIRDITENKRAEEALRSANDELESRVRDRTIKLAATVENLLAEIAEREKTEQTLLRLNSLYTVLSEINQSIVRATERDALFSDICRIAVKEGGFLLSWVGLLDEDGLLRIAASSGVAGYLDDIRVTKNAEPTGDGPTGITIREGTYYICNDFQNAPCTRPWHEKGRACGIKASASVALKEEGKVTGALTLYSEEKGFFDRQQVELLVQMGMDVSFALDNMAREARRQTAELALREEIIERGRLEQQLIEAKRLEAIGQLAGGLAHEVRNPLNAILSISEALFKEKGVGDNPEYEPYIHHIRTQVNRLAHLMNELLELGKPIDAASLHPVELREVCGDVINLLELSGVATEHRIDLIWGDVSAGLKVRADGVKLQQVVTNLLENAIQHSPEGNGIVLRISINEPQNPEEEMVVIRICDSGSGIPADRISRVFEPFYSTRRGGTGLGLALVKHFVEHMRGQVKIWNNDPYPGCTAEVRIPRAGEAGDLAG